MSKRLRRNLVAGAGAVAVVSLLAATPAYAQGRTEERTYSYLDGKGSPPRQHIEVPSWATRMSSWFRTCARTWSAGTP
jgi:hypothetical protein